MFVENAKKVNNVLNLRTYPKISKITFSNAFAKFKIFNIEVCIIYLVGQKSITLLFIS